MDPLPLLDLATSGFDRRVRAVSDDAWSLPTPCPDWTVRDLVNHVVAGNRMAVVLLAGASRDEAFSTLTGDALGADPIAAWADSARAQREAFHAPGASERVVHHPAGDVPSAQFLGYGLADLLLHGWDLARGAGGDETLDPEVTAVVWQGFAPMAPVIGSIGLFGDGPSGSVGEDAPLDIRLLDLTGRRPV